MNKSLEAQWAITFTTPTGSYGCGIIVIESNRIMGGDSNFAYIGTYKLLAGNIHGHVTIKRYALGMQSVFDNIAMNIDDTFELSFESIKNVNMSIKLPSFQIQANIVNNSNSQFNGMLLEGTLTHVNNLP